MGILELNEDGGGGFIANKRFLVGEDGRDRDDEGVGGRSEDVVDGDVDTGEEEDNKKK